jgi:hypothetical protein
MPAVYDRTESDGHRIVDRWARGVGWFTHPRERGRRTSHAVDCEDGVWLIDPLDAPGVEATVADLGDVAGVVVLSAYHARDAGTVADRYDVPVTVPAWLSRVPDRIEAPVRRIEGTFADFELRRARPLSLWRECVAYRPADGTLYVPDYLSPLPAFTVGDERLGLPALSRLSPPRRTFGDLAPERLLFGHGAGVFDDAAAALADALDGAPRRFPRALVSNLPRELRAMLGALRD